MYRILIFTYILLLFNSWKNEILASKVGFNYESFRQPTSSYKVHAWWHWMDGNVTKEGITKDLESMAQQGIVQATILNIGSLKNKEIGLQRVTFNSPEWYDLFQWSLQEAARLGITIGTHNCDGWSTSGGPWISPENSMKDFMWTKTYLKGGKKYSIKLSRPVGRRDFYRDVTVLAYRTNLQQKSFATIHPTCKMNDKQLAYELFDGSPATDVELRVNDKLFFSFPKPITASKISLFPRFGFTWDDTQDLITSFTLSASNDGKVFTELKKIDVKGINQPFVFNFKRQKAKFFKVELIGFNTPSWYKTRICELQVLEAGQTPAFTTNIPFHLAKTVSVRAENRHSFDVTDYSPKGNVINTNEVIELKDQLSDDGTLEWDAPKGDWCVLRFGYTTTGIENSPATAEGKGLECDKMDTTALNIHFQGFAEKLIKQAGNYRGNTFKFLFVDSWEAEYQNWTADFPRAFKSKRGYGIQSWIPALCGEIVGNVEQTEAFLYDFRKTIGELIDENYYRHFKELCHRNGIEMHAEAIYGESNYPAVDVLKINRHADMPMFEFWWNINKNGLSEYVPSYPFEVLPAAAATFYDKPVVGVEAYTGLASYSESPAEIKIFGDKAFASGMNQMILHSYVHQPFDKKPGVTLGIYSSHFNRNNPYWEHASEWLNYQTRIQSVLQQGLIASNILYYVGDKLPQYIDYKLLNSVPFGYRAIACNADILQNTMKVQNQKLITNNGLEYPLLVLQNDTVMEYATLKLIASLVEQGATVLGPRPTKQLSLNSIQNLKQDFERLAAKLWSGGNVTNYGKGKVLTNMTISEAIRYLNIIPDMAINSKDSLQLMYIRKKLGETDAYFVFNQRDSEFVSELQFGIGNKTPHLLNPVTGVISFPRDYRSCDGKICFSHTFKPHESVIVVFDNQSIKHNAIEMATELFTLSNLQATLTFAPAYDQKIEPVTITSLLPLTAFDNPDIKYFAGEVSYRIQFTLPDSFINIQDSFELDLGKFANTAEVILNGKRVGIVWMQGTKLPALQLLKTNNLLEIKLKTVFRNRIIGDYIQYGGFKNVWTTTDLKPYLGADKPLIQVGLTGPVTISRHKQLNILIKK